MHKENTTSNSQLPRPLVEDEMAEIARLRSMTFEQRGQWIGAACQAAAEIERSRRENGLPASIPAPWPPSTWALLKMHARHD